MTPVAFEYLPEHWLAQLRNTAPNPRGHGHQSGGNAVLFGGAQHAHSCKPAVAERDRKDVPRLGSPRSRSSLFLHHFVRKAEHQHRLLGNHARLTPRRTDRRSLRLPLRGQVAQLEQGRIAVEKMVQPYDLRDFVALVRSTAQKLPIALRSRNVEHRARVREHVRADVCGELHGMWADAQLEISDLR